MQTTTTPSGVRAQGPERPADELRRRAAFVPCALCRAPVDLVDVGPDGRALALCDEHRLLPRGSSC